MLNELKSAQSASYYFCSMVLTPRTLEVAKCNILQLELTALVQKDQYRDLRQPGTIAKRWDDYTVYKRVDRAISGRVVNFAFGNSALTMLFMCDMVTPYWVPIVAGTPSTNFAVDFVLLHIATRGRSNHAFTLWNMRCAFCESEPDVFIRQRKAVATFVKFAGFTEDRPDIRAISFL